MDSFGQSAALGALTDEEFQIGDVRFIVQKLGALEGFRTLELIRAQLGKSFGDVSGTIKDYLESDTKDKGDTDVKSGLAVVRVILGLNPAFIDQLRATLFKRIRYSAGGNPLEVLGGPGDVALDMCFNREGLGPGAIYEVLVRALVVNFFGSASALFARLGAFAPSDTAPSEQEASIPG